MNQWSVWELANASELVRNAEARDGWLPNWPEIKAQAENPDNYISGKGVDHYRRYEEDFRILKSLNLNSFRFGVEWSRLEPHEGAWSAKEVDHYRQYIKAMKRMDIEPVLNLWHWTLPVWFAEKGGFEKTSNIKYFERFVQKVAEEYGQELTYIITLNEPNVYASMSYGLGQWPPQVKNPLVAARVYWNLAQAHKRAYKIIKRINPKIQAGVAIHLNNSKASKSDDYIGRAMAGAAAYGWNRWFLNRVKSHHDFIGVNYYHTDYWDKFKTNNPDKPLNDLGWYMEPGGIYNVLIQAHKHYKKPLIITENGLADANDEHRRWWLEETMSAIRRARQDGADLRGYLHWSLLDNFEWAYGWWPKFGLVAVDRAKGMKRTVRPSAQWWSGQLTSLKK